MIETEGRTDGRDPLTHLEGIGIADIQCRQIVGIDLEERDIGLGISTDQLGL